jgi:hypothetical protein
MRSRSRCAWLVVAALLATAGPARALAALPVTIRFARSGWSDVVVAPGRTLRLDAVHVHTTGRYAVAYVEAVGSAKAGIVNTDTPFLGVGVRRMSVGSDHLTATGHGAFRVSVVTDGAATVTIEGGGRPGHPHALVAAADARVLSDLAGGSVPGRYDVTVRVPQPAGARVVSLFLMRFHSASPASGVGQLEACQAPRGASGCPSQSPTFGYEPSGPPAEAMAFFGADAVEASDPYDLLARFAGYTRPDRLTTLLVSLRLP